MLTPTILQRQITQKIIQQQQRHTILLSPLLTTHQNHHQRRFFAGGTRGSKGHGWLHHYRRGQGGRHLQGRWHNRDAAKLMSINDEMFALGTTTAFMDFRIGKTAEEKKRVVIELAERALPTTCRNFRLLCDGDANAADGRLGYRSTNVHKIEKNVGLMMGDVFDRRGAGGRCHPSVGIGAFDDESFVLSHVTPGMVSMTSPGAHRNDSRFLITLGDAPQLDGRFVCFGRVVEGMEVVEEMGGVFTRRGVPSVEIVVDDCGVVG